MVGGIGPPDSLGPEGAADPLDSVLTLPEVLDKKAWWGGDYIWVDPSHFHMMFLALPRAPLTINTDYVKSDDIKSYRDLLVPKWKGKITCFDPTISGAGREIFALLGDVMGKDYLKQLGDQQPVITRDRRLPMEWVARGKYPIGIGIGPDVQLEFKNLGAPTRTVTPAEGTFISGSGGGVLLMNKAPNHNAAQVFVNWLLSREGQTAASKAYGGQSAREDVPTDFLDPEVIRQPGVKYKPTFDLAYLREADSYAKIAQEMWAPLMK